MCHAMKLFYGMGVNPMVYELDQDPKGKDIKQTLTRLLGSSSSLPVSSLEASLSEPWIGSWLPISMAPLSLF